MANAAASVDISAPPAKVWALIGGFDSLPDWLPYIPKSELSEGGRIRSLANPNGEAIVERLMAFDEVGMSYSYAILKAPFPVTDYLSTLTVKPSRNGKGSHVEWTGRFSPSGVTDAQAIDIFRKIYEDGLAALASGFAREA